MRAGGYLASIAINRLPIPRQSTSVGIGVAHLGEQRLRVARDELVEHGALGRAASGTGERLPEAGFEPRARHQFKSGRDATAQPLRRHDG
jgi:hypothetical protein